VALGSPTRGALAAAGGERFVGETSAKQVFDRLAGTWTYWGWKGGYFDGEEDARAFFDEHRYMLAADGGAELAAMVQHRPALGLWHRRPGQGHYYVDFRPAS
jgi:ribonucleoside-diphosphate reductase alpha chain